MILNSVLSSLITFMNEPKKETSQETIKRESKGLAGNIAAELADASTLDVSDATYELLKFHGSYFGHNRDTATERKKQKLDKEYEFMLRTRIPGGRLNASQYLAMDELAGKYANGTLRITTRQVFQFHVILKKDLKAHIAAINQALLSTQSGCGDVVRNITCSPAPYVNTKYTRLRADVDAIAEFVRPKSRSYQQIWLDEAEDKIKETSLTTTNHQPSTVEPLYGSTYMPRKFKIGLCLPEDNSIDVFTHDMGIVLVFEGDVLKGYNILLGGGMGSKHEATKSLEDRKTYPRLADNIAFVGADDLIAAVEAAVKLQRDYGDRTDRQHSRLKYVVQERGVAWTKQTFAEYFAAAGGKQITEPVAITKYEIPNHMGWHAQGDGKFYYGLKVPSGRIVDYDKPDQSGYTNNVTGIFKAAQYRTGLRALVLKFQPSIVLTPTGEMMIADIAEGDKAAVETTLTQYGIPLHDAYTPMQNHFFTCVALPTCAKALAESERVQFPIMDQLTAELARNGLEKERMTIRIAGCPNGCSRPFVGDIGLVGRMPGAYAIFIGGDFEGTRLSTKLFDKVAEADIAQTLSPLFVRFAAEKNVNEGFGDFCHRVGIAV